MKKFVFIYFCFSFGEAAKADVSSDSTKQILIEGHAAYDSGDYEKAEINYQKVFLAKKASGHLFYNLGNTNYRLGKKGKAMAYFLAARSLMPRDPDVLANLKYIHSKIQDKLDIEAPFYVWHSLCFWTGKVTFRELMLTAFVAFLLAWCCFFLREFKKHYFFSAAGRFFIVVCLLGLSAGFGSFVTSSRWGAVTEEKIVVRRGPGKHNSIVFNLHEGAPFIVEDRKNGWYRILLSDGKKGWLKQEESLVLPTF